MKLTLRKSEGVKDKGKKTLFGNGFFTHLIDEVPMTYSEGISSFDSLFWKEAIKVEINSLLQNQTWKIVDLPLGVKPIGCKWIFKRKYFPNGSIDKYKARLVANGFTQKQNVNYFDTFSPVTRISSIWVLIVLALFIALLYIKWMLELPF